MNQSSPPKSFLRFFKWFCDPELHRFIEGDLYELYRERIAELGKKKADRRFARDVLLLFRPGIIRRPRFLFLQNKTAMFKINFILSWRNLLKNSGFSLINIGGLTLSMTVALLIGLWVQDEWSYDKFHKNYDEIYQVIANRDFGDFIFTDRNMVFPYARTISEEIPEVKHAVWINQYNTALLTRGETALQQSGMAVGGPFFDLFSWPFLQGNAVDGLAEPTSIIITESAAKRFFGDEDPLRQTLTLNNETEVTVSAVLQDPPDNSSFSFDYIRSFDLAADEAKRRFDDWNNYSWRVFVQPNPGTDLAQLESDLTEIMVERTESKQSSYFVFPMKKWHLYDEFKDGVSVGGGIRYVRLFGIIAVIILVIACINFMNLSTARSQKRSVEVAVRKTLGSGRASLIQQFLTESTLIALIAFFGALIAVFLLLPAFNQLVDKSLKIDLSNPLWWAAGLLLVLASGLLAGSYPAFLLSSFKPISVLNGDADRERKTITPRRFLVVFQFVASIALISATILVFQQIQFIKNRDMGYDPDNLIMIPSTGTINKNYTAIKDQLLQSGQVDVMTHSNSPITQIWNKSHAPQWPGRPEGLDILFSKLYVGTDFTKAMDIDILAGRDFRPGLADTASVLLNQAAVEAMKLEEPVGQRLQDGNGELTVIGVIDDVVIESPFASVEPLMVHYAHGWSGYISIRLKDGVQPQAALGSIESTFKHFNPAYPFEYEFVDEAFGEKFAGEQMMRKITNIFAGMAIFISCLGLIGLVAYIIEKRMKEIAIRKVLGASPRQLLFLVASEFMILVGIALVIATPITYYGINSWLQNYDYQVGVSFLVFLAVGTLLMVLTLLIVGVQTTRAALANPIYAIRSER